MRILALITARGGSRRLPGKNVRPLSGKPLVTWSVDVATGIADICDILMSTDDSAIADIGRAAGALVPWLRPAALATDVASSVDVAVHAVDWYEKTHSAVDGLMLLQPTSPFRTRATVLRGIELFRAHEHRPVVAMSPAPCHPMWCFRLDESDGTLQPFMKGDGMQLASQDLPPAYVVNGSLYLVAPKTLRARRSFFSDDMVPLVVADQAEAIDIDTELDWALAEAVLAEATRNSST